MPNVLLPIQNGSLDPPGVCFGSEQERVNAFSAVQFAVLSGSAFYNYGNTKPSVENNAYPWLNTNDMRWYRFDGIWISNANLNANERRIFVGSEDDLKLYDGGNTNIPSDRNGPMWVIDPAFAARFPVGVGTFAASGSVAVLGTGGADKVTLTEGQLPSHVHPHGDPSANLMSAYTTTPNQNTYRAFDAGAGDCSFNEFTGETGDDEPHNNLVPYIGVYIIMPSGRTYYSVT